MLKIVHRIIILHPSIISNPYLSYFFICFLYVTDQPQRQNTYSEEYNNRNGYPQKHYENVRSQNYNNNGKWYNEKRQNRRSEESRGYREQSAGHGGATSNNNKSSSNRNENHHERELNSVDRDSNSSVEVNNSRRRPKARNNASNHSGK